MPPNYNPANMLVPQQGTHGCGHMRGCTAAVKTGRTAAVLLLIPALSLSTDDTADSRAAAIV